MFVARYIQRKYICRVSAALRQGNFNYYGCAKDFVKR